MELLRTLDPKQFDVTVEEIIKSSLNVITVQVQSNDKYINKQGRFASASQETTNTKFDDETSDEEGLDSENKQKSKQIKLELGEKTEGTVSQNVLKRRLINFEYVCSKKVIETKFDPSVIKVENVNNEEPKMETDAPAVTTGTKDATVKTETSPSAKQEDENGEEYSFEIGCFSETIFPTSAMASLRYLYDCYLLSNEEQHIMVYDPNASVRVFDCSELKEILPSGNDSKDTSGGRNRSFGGRFLACSPLSSAVCAFNPGKF